MNQNKILENFKASFSTGFKLNNSLILPNELFEKIEKNEFLISKNEDNFFIYTSQNALTFFINDDNKCFSLPDCVCKISARKEEDFAKFDNFLNQNYFKTADALFLMHHKKHIQNPLLDNDIVYAKDQNLAKDIHEFLSDFFGDTWMIYISQNDIKEKIAKNEILLDIYGGKITGVLIFSKNLGQVVIDYIATKKECRKNGAFLLMSKLFSDTENLSKKIFVSYENTHAIKFYERLGFEKISSSSRIIKFYKNY